MLLGCIADDITGATDLALMLAKSGMRTVQVMGVPEGADDLASYDAVVVALKSRTNPVDEAIAWSLASAEVLLAAGAEQLFFKYCSTFDSTPEGNIGPVADALMDKLGADLAIVCPAFPANARSIYQGHLFVGDALLSDSPMKDHPLTPMRDANLVRVMAGQCKRSVHLVAYKDVQSGVDSVRSAFACSAEHGSRYVVTDAIDNAHLMIIGEAIADHKLITGGSGIAMGLADNFVRQGKLAKSPPPETIVARPGRMAVLAGSCSAATRRQVAVAQSRGVAARKLDPHALINGSETADGLTVWAIAQADAAPDQPVLIYSSDDPEQVAAVQTAIGQSDAGALIEQTLAALAQGLVAAGFTRLIVAGGETSGAVAEGLQIAAIEIGPEIDPGVPWVRSLDGRELAIAFKSGNFGADDFFLRAWDLLETTRTH